MQSEHCREFEDRSRELPGLDELLADTRLREHAASCVPCAARRSEMQQLQLAEAASRKLVPAVDLTASVLTQWRSQLPAGRSTPEPVQPAQSSFPPARTARLSVPAAEPERSRPAAALALAASAAVLLVAATTITLIRDNQPASHNQRLMVDSPAADVPAAGRLPEDLPRADSASPGTAPAAVAPLQSVPLDRLVWNAGNAWVGLTTATMTEVTASALATTGTGSHTDPTDLENPDADWLKELKGTLGPVQDDLSRTVEFLIETLPLTDASTI